MSPERHALIGHARNRGPVRLADGRRATLLFAAPKGNTARVQFHGGGHLTVHVDTITIIDEPAQETAA